MTLHQVVSHIGQSIALDDTTQRWAFHLALIERLAAYGTAGAVYCYQNDDKRADIAIWLEGVWYTCCTVSGFSPNDWPGRYLGLDTSEQLINAATWNGIDKSALLTQIAVQQEQLGQHLSALLKAPSFTPGSSPLLLRLKIMQDNNINIRDIYYHETERENVSSILSNGFHLSSPVARLRETHFPDGVFMKRHREKLDIAHDPVNIPVFLKESPHTSFADRNALLQATHKLTAYQGAINAIEAVNSVYDAQCDTLLKLDNTEENRAKYDEILARWKDELHPLAARARAALKTHFLSEQKSILHILHDEGSHGRSVETFLALNPKDVTVGPAAYQAYPTLNLLPDVRKQIATFDKLIDAAKQYTEALTPTQWAKLHAEILELPLSLVERVLEAPEKAPQCFCQHLERTLCDETTRADQNKMNRLSDPSPTSTIGATLSRRRG